MGRALARRLKMKNVDGDKVIERTYGKKLCDIIAEEGLDGFKNIEEKVLLSISGDNLIISTGGSAVYYPAVMEYYKSIGKIVYLHCSKEELLRRLGDYSKRGIVLRDGQTFDMLYDERCVLYEKYADIIVDCSGEAYSMYQKRVISALSYYN